MSKNHEQQTITVNSITCFSKLIKSIFISHKIPINKQFYIKSIFFKKFYKLRKINDLLEENEVIIQYKLLKKVIYSCIIEINNFLEYKISYQKVLNQFLKELGFLKLNEDVQLNLTNLSIECSSKNKTSILTQCEALISKNNKPSKWAIKTLFRFLYSKETKSIPFELIIILIADAQKIYEYNKKLFIGTSAFNTHIMEEAISLRLKQFGDIIYLDNQSFYYKNEPYKKMHLEVQLFGISNSITFSLPYLIDYFGHSSWYKSFIFYKQEEFEDYLKFNVNDF